MLRVIVLKTGKLSNDMLNRLILEPAKKYGVKNERVLTKPSVGEDCAALKFGNEICLLSADPITGAAENVGRLAVYINSNDIASAGGRVVGLMVTTLLPPDITEREIAALSDNLYKSAAEAGITVLGGHTEITDAVTRPVISCTAIGVGERFVSSGGARVGDSVVMTKYAALEGTLIISSDYREFFRDKLTKEELDLCAGLQNSLSVAPEGEIAAKMGASAMHDVTEGGILGACHEIAECSGVGITVFMDKIPILGVTEKICKLCDIDPYRLISSGSMLIAAGDGEALCRALSQKGIKASAIGKITERERLVCQGGAMKPLLPPDTDELYRAGRNL